MSTTASTVFVQVVERPERQIMVKRGVKATDYYAYCDEAGCDASERIWGVLSSVKEALYEPIGMWLSPQMIPEGTSKYVQGVELPLDYHKPLPEGYERADDEAPRFQLAPMGYRGYIEARPVRPVDPV